MYYQQKKTITLIITEIIILAAYGVYVFQKYQAGVIDLENDLKFWASTMLFFVVVAVVFNILILILFHILNAVVNEVKQQDQDDPMIEDEMDKLINLKAMRNSYMMVGLGFVISIVSLAMEKPPTIMLNIVFLAFNLGSIFEGFSKLYFYKRGV